MSKKKQELVKKEETQVANFDEGAFGDVGPAQDITPNDVTIPRILNMQPLSPKVVDGEAEFGQLRDNLEWEILAEAKKGDTPAKALEVVPFHWEKYWINKKQEDGQFKFEELVRMDRTNQNKNPWEEWKGEDGILRKREYLHVFYVLLPNKAIPYAIGFKGASRKAGDNLVTQMYTINKGLKNVPPHTSSPMGKVIEITPIKLKKDNRTYMAMEVKPVRDTDEVEAYRALEWYHNVSDGQAAVDLSEEDEVDRVHKGGF